MLKSKIQSKRRERKKASAFGPQPWAFACAAFTLVEMLVTLALLSIIVLALMAVFNSTQNAFRASLTETDILESGRNVMGLMAGDLEGMTPASSPVNPYLPPAFFWSLSPGVLASTDPFNTNDNFNFYAAMAKNVSAPRPLVQSLTASSRLRTNVLENFFSLSRQNIDGSPSWVGTGYAVFTNTPETNGIYSLYRFYMTTSTMRGTPALLYNFFARLNYTNTAMWSHLLDGVVDLTVTPYDPNGLAMTNTPWYSYSSSGQRITNYYPNTVFFAQSIPGVHGCYMYSNTVPASVEVELGVLEDAVLQHAKGLPNSPPDYAQTAYLSNHVGQVHLFRQRVWIRNVDPAAYQ